MQFKAFSSFFFFKQKIDFRKIFVLLTMFIGALLFSLSKIMILFLSAKH